MTAHFLQNVLRLAFRGGALCCLLVLFQPTPVAAQNALISRAGDQTTVTLACNHFPPAKIASDNAKPGYDVEILRSALATRNLTLLTPFYPWKRAYFLAESGLVDGLCSCSYLAERETDFLFSNPLGQEQIAFFMTQPELLDDINSLEDARNMTIGVVSGYSTEASARTAGVDIIAANDEETLINLLLLRRLDAIWSFKPPVDDVLAKLEKIRPEAATITSKIISKNPYYTCISRSRENASYLLEQLNIGLTTLRENGVYDKILEKYGVTPDVASHTPQLDR